MEDNKKDYDEYLKNDEPKESEVKQEKPSYYYSYGPYKSSETEERSVDAQGTNHATGDRTEVEVTSPSPLRTMDTYENVEHSSTRSAAAVPKEPRRRVSGKSFFAGFLASAVVLASLMVYSDKMNLFTGDQVTVNVGNAAPANASVGSPDVKTAAVSSASDIVRPNNIAQIVESSSPAVVKIETLVKPKTRQGQSGGSLFDDPIFRQFFGDDGSEQQQEPQQDPSDSQGLQPLGMGSGFIFEKSGYILTNEHVIDGSDEIQVTVQGYEKPFIAKLLGNSYDLDLAVLKIVGTKDFPILPLGNVENTSVGDWVVAIGNPYGFEHTVTVGVLSAKERPIEIPDQQGTRNYKHLLQTDASINPGNSGGPLLNLNGEVIGINTAVSSQAQGIGFAIPTSTIQGVLDSLIKNVTIPKEPAPYIGVTVLDVPPSNVKDLQLTDTSGALVRDVPMGGPAFKAGIKTYDVILGVNGAEIKKSGELITKIQALKVADKVTLNISRDGKKMDVSVTIGDKNKDAAIIQQQQQQQQ
ncbi:PDZ domain-containing protein [Paenibacillus psychroresistens]|uniref:PDZ domain-containing protein n=1 Tax=Paenibacillus psychroresistens TaxID=1778678 RepID=A0A6B8RIP7_9BACL|nr:trypsin-like peptidase domain-containing protein [Paenibacillus psychroresistens]QGQ95256.1 PDZ domain-containing protein [Paenibacillus psychroresistens]